jgi:P27 family predicted phage terminase small subunit
MAEKGRPKAPRGLGKEGRALWRSVQGQLDAAWELDARDYEALHRACRCADELAALEAVIDAEGVTTTGSRKQVIVHPAVSEARQLRLAQARLLSGIELCDPAEKLARQPLSTQRARRAAQARHDKSARTAALRAV